MSPGGTGEISTPEEPNFMCTGLVTVAPFFGSTKNTRAFFEVVAFFAAGLVACAAAPAPNPITVTRTSSASCLLLSIHDSPSPHILAEQASKPSAGRLLD